MCLALLVLEVHGRIGQMCPLPSWHVWSNTELLVPGWAGELRGVGVEEGFRRLMPRSQPNQNLCA